MTCLGVLQKELGKEAPKTLPIAIAKSSQEGFTAPRPFLDFWRLARRALKPQSFQEGRRVYDAIAEENEHRTWVPQL